MRIKSVDLLDDENLGIDTSDVAVEQSIYLMIAESSSMIVRRYDDKKKFFKTDSNDWSPSDNLE